MGIDADFLHAALVLVRFLVLLSHQRRFGEVREHYRGHGFHARDALLTNLLHQPLRVWDEADWLVGSEAGHGDLHTLILVNADGVAILFVLVGAHIGLVQLHAVIPLDHAIRYSTETITDEYPAFVTVGEALGVVVVRVDFHHAASHAVLIHQLATTGKRILAVNHFDVDNRLVAGGQSLLDNHHVKLAHLVNTHVAVICAGLPLHAETQTMLNAICQVFQRYRNQRRIEERLAQLTVIKVFHIRSVVEGGNNLAGADCR